MYIFLIIYKNNITGSRAHILLYLSIVLFQEGKVEDFTLYIVFYQSKANNTLVWEGRDRISP